MRWVAHGESLPSELGAKHGVQPRLLITVWSPISRQVHSPGACHSTQTRFLWVYRPATPFTGTTTCARFLPTATLPSLPMAMQDRCWRPGNTAMGILSTMAQVQPLIGHGGYDPVMYAYLIYRNAIEWAFEAANLPIIKLSPWPYEYDAAFIVRHDFENNPTSIRSIEDSASFENSIGVKGDYYFCTGTLREEMPLTKARSLPACGALSQTTGQRLDHIMGV